MNLEEAKKAVKKAGDIKQNHLSEKEVAGGRNNFVYILDRTTKEKREENISR